MAEAPAPYGARRPVPSASSGSDWSEDSWSPTTAVRSTAVPQPQPQAQPYVPPQAPAGRVREPITERGLPGWGAVLVLVGIAGVGGVIDAATGTQIRGGFNYGIVVASFVAILMVRRSAMFAVVVAPPIVYSAGSAAMLYVRSSGGHDKRVLFDAAANWLVYGFPAIAAATAVVLIIAGVRLIARR
jgi:hypothetical protein